jgi:hypothetical protein
MIKHTLSRGKQAIPTAWCSRSEVSCQHVGSFQTDLAVGNGLTPTHGLVSVYKAEMDEEDVKLAIM